MMESLESDFVLLEFSAIEELFITTKNFTGLGLKSVGHGEWFTY